MAKKRSNSDSFSAILEGYNRKMLNKTAYPSQQPAGLSQAFARSKKGSNKPKLRAQHMKGK